MKLLSAIVLVLSVALFSSEAIATEEWSLTGSGISCSSIEKICITLEKMVVDKTPNDPGSYEEWKMTTKLSSGDSTSFAKSVKDNLSSARTYSINKTVCIPMSSVDNSFPVFRYEVTGYEDDTFFDDPIPKINAMVRDTVCHDIEVNPFGKTGLENNWCKYSSDKKRRACYYLKAEYRSASTSGPTLRKCPDGQKCCGALVSGGLCAGQCWPSGNPCP